MNIKTRDFRDFFKSFEHWAAQAAKNITTAFGKQTIFRSFQKFQLVTQIWIINTEENLYLQLTMMNLGLMWKKTVK